MTQALLSAVTLLIAIVCVPARAELAADQRLNALCESIQSYSACGEAIERFQLTKGVKGVARSDGSLLIQVEDGHLVHLNNQSPGDPQGFAYQYIEYFPQIGFHLIHKQYYEGDDFLMVSDADGGRYFIPGVPHVSPNKKLVVVVVGCEAYCTNGVFIFFVRDGTLSPSFWFEPDEYALYSFVSWNSNESIALTKIVHADTKQCPGSQFMTVPVVLKKAEGPWKWQQSDSKIKCE